MMVLTTIFLLPILASRVVSKGPDLEGEERLFSFEDSLSRADVGTYYLSFVVALAMVVPVFYLSPVGQGRSLGGPPRNPPKSGGIADDGK